ncbi:ABC transporter permease [Streptomyces armeniacus]|uniref:Transport permease protein n=1 Tax=Streptomyces armeniacus TaxID=83291 RepID=A0A345XNZ5_9ACTN|nr:ABC transporter permease [Streptomyces armeniacus]AXK33361.1 ABC transporter permease [Streptomyces armeniacus]
MEAPAVPLSPLSRVRWTLTDGMTLAVRPLVQLRHRPQVLIAALAFPVIMVVLLGYVLGSAVEVPGGGDYREYLMPGLFVMMSFTSVSTNATDVAADNARGIMERLRSMPMSRLAVPFGQTGADIVIGSIALSLMVGCGLAVGWQPHEGMIRAAAAVGIIMLLRYAMSWVGVYIGLVAGSEQMAGRLAPFFFPVALISTAFVPTDDMPAWLRTIANWNPVSAGVEACRELFGSPGNLPEHAPLPLQHPVEASLLWAAVLLVVFVPLAVRAYRLRGR